VQADSREDIYAILDELQEYYTRNLHLVKYAAERVIESANYEDA
jgi:hypothetical protein